LITDRASVWSVVRKWRLLYVVVALAGVGLTVTACGGGSSVVVESGKTTSVPGSLLANLFVGGQGSCKRSPSPVPYSAGNSCSTFQRAYNASSCGDVVGVEPETYTGIQIVSKKSGSSCSSYATFKPDNGIVTFNATMSDTPSAQQAHACSYCALELGDLQKGYNSGLDPPSWIAFDGGPNKDFHFGTPGVEGSGGVMGQIKLYASYGSPPSQYYASDHVKLTNLIVCNACPDPGSGTVEIDNATNFILSNSQIGPICCGLDHQGNPAGSPTELLIGPRSGFPNPSRGLIIGNVFLGETRCGKSDAATSCSPGFWPTSALGAAPQNNCDTSCHGDAVHDEGSTDTSYINNIFRNSQAQAIFLEGATSGIESNITLVGNEIDSLASCGICASTEVVRGQWTIAFNTVYPGLGFDDPDAGNAAVQSALTAGFTQPEVNSDVTVAVSSSSGFAAGQYFAVGDASDDIGYYKVVSVLDGTDVTLQNLGAGGASPGTVFVTPAIAVIAWWPDASVAVVGNIAGQGNHDFSLNGSGCGEWSGITVTYSYNFWVNHDRLDARCGVGDIVAHGTSFSQIVVHAPDWNSSLPDNDTNFDLKARLVGNTRLDFVPAAVCDSFTRTDLHGTLRPQTGFCYAGADEFASASPHKLNLRSGHPNNVRRGVRR
jgi:hypothetical protein